MTRAALFVIFYAFVGTIVAMTGYRLMLEGPLASPDQGRAFDGPVLIISMLLYTALVFSAAGLAAVWVYPLRRSWTVAVLASALVAAVAAPLMIAWLHGLSIEFPAVAALSAMLCGVLARLLGLFEVAETRGR
jgi:hypothetical protein